MILSVPAYESKEDEHLEEVLIEKNNPWCEQRIRELNLPKYVVPMLGLCVGYPAELESRFIEDFRRSTSRLRQVFYMKMIWITGWQDYWQQK